MEHDKFVAIMPYICSDLAKKIQNEQELTEDEAISKLYASELYSFLEQEETKLWQYSTPMLYHLFLQGEDTGTIQFPDV